QYRNGDGALHHRGEEDGGRGLDAHFLVAHGEPAQRAALQAERLDHRLCGDVFLHGAEQRRFVELLLVIRLHRLRRQDPRTDQRDREYQQRDRRKLPVQEQHQDDACDQFQERQRGAVGKRLDRTFEGRKVDREAREDFAALGAGEIRGRQVLDVLEQLVPYVGNDRRRQPRIPALIPDRDDRGDDAGDREHAEDLVERLKVLLAERVVDQEFQAQRHDDVEQRLDENAEGHEGEQLAVIAQIRPNEAVNGGHRTGGFLGGEDDEVLVIIIVVELQFVLFVVLVIVGGDAGGLAAGKRRDCLQHELLRQLGIVRRHGILIIRRRRLGRHETNRYCTAGMTANRTRQRKMLPRRSYAIGMNSAKQLERPALITRTGRNINRPIRPCRRTNSAGCRRRRTTAPAPCWRPASPPTLHRCSRGGASRGRSRCRRTIQTIPTKCRASSRRATGRSGRSALAPCPT